VGVHTSQAQSASLKTSANIIGCAALALAGSLAGGGGLPATTATTLAAAMAYGLLWVGGMTWTTSWAVARLPVGRASLLMTLELVVALLSGAWIGGERLHGLSLIGAVGILLAVSLELLPARRSAAGPEG